MFVGVNLKNHYNGQLKNHVGVLLALAVVAFNFLNKKTHLLFKIRTFLPTSVSVFSKYFFKD